LIKITDYAAPYFQGFSNITLCSPLSVLFAKAYNSHYSLNLKPSFVSNLNETTEAHISIFKVSIFRKRGKISAVNLKKKTSNLICYYVLRKPKSVLLLSFQNILTLPVFEGFISYMREITFLECMIMM